MTAALQDDWDLHIPDELDDAAMLALTDPQAPHETHGCLRMLRGGMTGPKIAEVLNLPVGPQLEQQMYRGLNQEGDAKERGVPIFDGTKDDDK